jgi:hypothetical protein
LFHEKPTLPFLLLFPLNFVSHCARVLHCSNCSNCWWQTANTMSLWNDGVMNGKTCKVMVQQSERCLWHNDGRVHRTTTWKDTVKLCNKKIAQKNDCKVCTKQCEESLDLRPKANHNYGDGKNWLKTDCVVDRLLLVLNTKSSYSKKFR